LSSQVFAKVQKRVGRVMTITLSTDLLVVDNTQYSSRHPTAVMVAHANGTAWRSLCAHHPTCTMVTAGENEELRFALHVHGAPRSKPARFKWSSGFCLSLPTAGEGTGAAGASDSGKKLFAIDTPDGKKLWVVARVETLPVKAIVLSNLVSLSSMASQTVGMRFTASDGRVREFRLQPGETLPLLAEEAIFSAYPDGSHGTFQGHVQVSLLPCPEGSEVGGDHDDGDGGVLMWSEAIQIAGIQRVSHVDVASKVVSLNLRRVSSLTSEYVLFLDVAVAPVKTTVATLSSASDDHRVTTVTNMHARTNRPLASVSISIQNLDTRLFHKTSAGTVLPLVSVQTEDMTVKLLKGSIVDAVDIKVLTSLRLPPKRLPSIHSSLTTPRALSIQQCGILPYPIAAQSPPSTLYFPYPQPNQRH
jgi:hypothetical protein